MHRQISKTWLLALLAMCSVLVSFVPSGKSKKTQIYARIEEVLNTPYGSPYGSTTDYYQSVNVRIYFYSDAGCTTPATLPADVNFDISYTGYLTLQSGTEEFSGIFESGTATAGSTYGYGSDNTHEGLLMNNGVQEERYRQDYELSSIGGGIIIVPPITQPHLPGF
jgi:hypothetical protein